MDNSVFLKEKCNVYKCIYLQAAAWIKWNETMSAGKSNHYLFNTNLKSDEPLQMWFWAKWIYRIWSYERTRRHIHIQTFINIKHQCDLINNRIKNDELSQLTLTWGSIGQSWCQLIAQITVSAHVSASKWEEIT